MLKHTAARALIKWRGRPHADDYFLVIVINIFLNHDTFRPPNKRAAESLRAVSMTDSCRPPLSRLSATPCNIYGALSYLCTFREQGAFVNRRRGWGGERVRARGADPSESVRVRVRLNAALRRGEL